MFSALRMTPLKYLHDTVSRTVQPAISSQQWPVMLSHFHWLSPRNPTSVNQWLQYCTEYWWLHSWKQPSTNYTHISNDTTSRNITSALQNLFINSNEWKLLGVLQTPHDVELQTCWPKIGAAVYYEIRSQSWFPQVIPQDPASWSAQ